MLTAIDSLTLRSKKKKRQSKMKHQKRLIKQKSYHQNNQNTGEIGGTLTLVKPLVEANSLAESDDLGLVNSDGAQVSKPLLIRGLSSQKL